jgi:hypothetical protein
MESLRVGELMTATSPSACSTNSCAIYGASVNVSAAFWASAGTTGAAEGFSVDPTAAARRARLPFRPALAGC